VNQWLVGWLEGEGHFRAHLGSPLVQGCTTDLDVAERAMAAMPGARMFTERRVPPIKNLHVVKLLGYTAERLMVKLLPHMGTRRQQQIRQALAVWRSKPRRAELTQAQKDQISISHKRRRTA
jgi:hypothetical protein